MECEEVSGLYHIFFNRLKITIGRTGLTFFEDVRDRRRWMEEMLRWNETAIFEEVDEEYIYPNMIIYMDKWEERDKEYWFNKITGKDIHDYEFMRRSPSSDTT